MLHVFVHCDEDVKTLAGLLHKFAIRELLPTKIAAMGYLVARKVFRQTNVDVVVQEEPQCDGSMANRSETSSLDVSRTARTCSPLTSG